MPDGVSPHHLKDTHVTEAVQGKRDVKKMKKTQPLTVTPERWDWLGGGIVLECGGTGVGSRKAWAETEQGYPSPLHVPRHVCQ